VSARTGAVAAIAAIVAVAGLALGPREVRAQQLEIAVTPAPHHVGQQIDIRITATGFEEEPAPQIRASEPRSGRLEFVGTSPNVSEQIVLSNGTLERTKTVRFVFAYRFTSDTPGRVELGPFLVAQGGTVRETAPVGLEIREIASSDRLDVRLVLGAKPVYVGERITVGIELWIERGLRESLAGYELRVPLFDDPGRFRFVDAPPASRDTTDLVVTLAGGPLELAGTARQVREEGKQFLVVRADRTMIPLVAGGFDVAPSNVVASEGVSFRRDFFGSRRATRVRQLRSTDRPRRLVIRPVPTRGRPASFAGAIGKGFSLDVTVDRSVVQVGDPIDLAITLRGGGDLSTAALPPLHAPGLLPDDQFRAPDGELAGRVDGSRKHFSAQVRVLSADVREIPALEYSWFDPDAGSFQTARSRPIALSVRPAQVIGADSVIRAPRDDAAAEEAEAAGTRQDSPASPPTERSSALRLGADLAIQTDPDALLTNSSRAFGGTWLPTGLYAFGFALVGVAFVDRRRRAIDPADRALRQSRARELAAIRREAAKPGTDSAAALASALRRMLADSPERSSRELDALLGECDALAFARDANRTPSAELTARIVEHAQALAGEGS